MNCPKDYRKNWRNTYRDKALLALIGAGCAVLFWLSFLLA
jgi:hypothetical protein